jgi:hypothetical protein
MLAFFVVALLASGFFVTVEDIAACAKSEKFWPSNAYLKATSVFLGSLALETGLDELLGVEI